MPELPEVQTVVRTLAPHVTGIAILSVSLRRPDILNPPGLDLPSLLIGRRFRRVHRRGKRIIFTLDDGNRFFIHLGMTGRLTAESPSAPLAAHTHLLITTAPIQIRFRDPRRFGGLHWLGLHQSPSHNLGPEPLLLRPSQLARLLQQTHRPIKSALMDQTFIAGLGNIYADESLFSARIHPSHPADTLSPAEVRRLCLSIQRILRRAISLGGSSINDYVDARGLLGGFQHHHQVYQRTGKPCPSCRTPIARILLSGRSTHFCPHCQPPRRRGQR